MPVTTYFFAAFGQANGTSLSGLALDASGGAAVNWVQQSGVWTTQSGKASQASTAGAYYVTASNGIHANGIISVKMTLPSAANYIGLINARWTDANNRIAFFIERDSGGTPVLYIAKVIASSLTLLNQVNLDSAVTGATVTITATLNGPHMDVDRDGIEKISWSDSNAQQTATAHGFGVYMDGTYQSVLFDDFTFTSLPKVDFSNLFTSDFTNYNSDFWTLTGANQYSIVSNNLRCVGASATTSSLKYNRYLATGLENWKITAHLKPVTSGGSDFGIAFGIKCTNPFDSGAAGMAAQIGFSTGVAKVVINSVDTDGTTFTLQSISGSGLTYSVGDEFVLTFENNKYIYTATITNLANSTSVSCSYDLTGFGTTYSSRTELTGQFALWSVGGTQDVISLTASSTVTTSPHSLLIGDSITEGAFAASYAGRWAERLFVGTGKSHVVHAKGSDTTQQALDCINEIVSLTPTYAIIMLGGNDVQFAVSSGVWQANYSSLVAQLRYMGVIPIHCYATPRNATDMTTFNAWIASTFASDRIVDTFTPLATGTSLATDRDSGDHVHPNALGHELITSTVATGVYDFLGIIVVTLGAGTGATSNANGGTLDWLNPGNITAADGSYATSVAAITGLTTYYLKATNFGFTIPGFSIILGVQDDVLRKSTVNPALVDSSTKMIVQGTIQGSEYAIASNWPTTAAYQQYGGFADSWGNTLTAAILNDPTTGVAIAAVSSAGATAEIDYVRRTVWYRVLPVEEVSWFYQPVIVSWRSPTQSYSVEEELIQVTVSSFEEEGLTYTMRTNW